MELVVRIHAHLALSQTNKLLKQTETRLQLLSDTIDITSDNVYWLNVEGRFIYVNASACKMLGYSQEELQNLHISNISVNATPERWNEIWQLLY